MAIYRSVNMSFWTDTKVVDTFTPEDKYFMLYCLTNSHTNILGCYEISVKQMANETGYSQDSVNNLLERFSKVHKIIEYDFKTKEILIRNWYKYNWSKSPKLDDYIRKALDSVKSIKFRNELIEIFNSRDTVSIPYVYPMDTSNTNTNANTNTVSNTKTNIDTIKEIIDYLNIKTGSRYQYNNKNTVSSINQRLEEGFTLDDFKNVIDKKCDEWLGTEYEKFLRPSTLFRPSKFEGYVNQKVTNKDNNMFGDDLAF